MNTDIRINVNYFDHPKILDLHDELGNDGIVAHLRLLTYVGKYYSDGNLTKLSIARIESSCGWRGEPELLFQKLVSVGLVDYVGDCKCIHDWEHHNGYAAHAEQRSEQARVAANARWQRKYESCSEHTNSNAVSIQPAYAERNAERNAPSPSPSPDLPVLDSRDIKDKKIRKQTKQEIDPYFDNGGHDE